METPEITFGFADVLKLCNNKRLQVSAKA